MVEHHHLVGCLRALVTGSVLLASSVALAGPKDKSATALAKDAMQTDYLATNFKKAEQKLKKAIGQCKGSACSSDVVGRLHRDLATVYIGGLKQAGKGKAEMKLAVKADPDLQLDNDFATPESRKAFAAAGGHAPKEEEEEPEPARNQAEKKVEECEPGSDGCDKPAAEPEAKPQAPGKGAKNWLSVHFEQDFLIYSAQDNVCASYGANTAGAPNYACFQGSSQFGNVPEQLIPAGPGNHVSGGLGRATSRVLLGFDRLLGSNVSLGLRVGFAFNGGPNTKDKFLPIHGEIRANYWFGAAPFESSSVRPYVSLSGGVAEVDGHVLVEYYDAKPSKGTLDAWRKTGKGFAGLGFGMMIPFAGDNGIVPEVRLMQLFGAPGTAFDLALGYAHGF